jgi:CRP-like cAMP-binding protein
MFPTLDDEQIAHVSAYGEQRSVQPGEVLFDQGDSTHGVFVVLEGSLELVSVSRDGESVIGTHSRGRIHGRDQPALGAAEPGSLPGARSRSGRRNQQDLFAESSCKPTLAIGEMFCALLFCAVCI